MTRIGVDVDSHLLALAQRQQLGAESSNETVRRALLNAASVSAEDRARGLAWLQANVDDVLDLDFLEARERDGR